MRRPLLALLATTACAAALTPGAAHAAVVLGPSSLTGFTGWMGCASESGFTTSCTKVQVRATAGSVVVAPQAGVITRWRMAATAVEGRYKLRVVRHTGSKVKVLRSSTERTGVGQPVLEYPTRLAIAAGDRVALGGRGATTDTGPGFAFRKAKSTLLDDLHPSPMDGASATPTRSTGYEVLYQAVVEPDGDHDGYGDETQDPCPKIAGSKAPCPPIPSSPVVPPEPAGGAWLSR